MKSEKCHTFSDIVIIVLLVKNENLQNVDHKTSFEIHN